MVLEELFSQYFTMTTTELIYNLFLPFIFVFAIFFALLSGAFRKFSNRINFLLALVFAIFTASTPTFSFIGQILIGWSGYGVIILFFGVFIVGAVMWGWYRGKDIYYRNVTPHTRVREINKRIAKLQRDLDRARTEEEEMQILKNMHQLELMRDRYSYKERW
jgi:polyferredoxin